MGGRRLRLLSSTVAHGGVLLTTRSLRSLPSSAPLELGEAWAAEPGTGSESARSAGTPVGSCWLSCLQCAGICLKLAVLTVARSAPGDAALAESPRSEAAPADWDLLDSESWLASKSCAAYSVETAE